MHKTVKPQVARWFEVLQEFDFDVKFRPGSRMSHVDVLSRAVPPTPAEGVLSINEELSGRLDVFVTMSAIDRVRFMQQADPVTKNLVQLASTTRALTDHETSMLKPYTVYDGVYPWSMRKGIVIGVHDYEEHFSLNRTLANITKNYWFPCLKRYCTLIQKTPAGKRSGHLHPVPTGRRPFEIVHIDH